MAELGTYTKRLFSMSTAIIVTCIATLVVVSCVLLCKESRPVINPRIRGMKKTNTNGATSQSTRRRLYTMGEHYFLAPELDQYYRYTNLNTVTMEFKEAIKVRNVDITWCRHKVSLLNRNIRSAGLFLLVGKQHVDKCRLVVAICEASENLPITEMSARFVTSSTTARISCIVHRLFM